MDDQEAFVRVNTLIQEIPVNSEDRDGIKRWLSKANAIIEVLKVMGDTVSLARIHQFEGIGRLDRALSEMSTLLLRNSARLELRLPVQSQGAFIGVGNSMDAFAAVSQILQQAKASIRIIDPYMDEKALTSFAVLAAEGINVELLSDSATAKPAYSAAVSPWKNQYGTSRPLDARLSPPRTLHDRMIVVDGATVHTVTQSLKDIAARSPASIIKVDAETAGLKIPAYDAIWAASQAIA